MARLYRCGHCEEDWPPTEEFKQCANCGTNCRAVDLDDVETPDYIESQSRASHMRFAQYLEKETDEQRREREAKSPYKSEFHRVIDGANFQEWERASITGVEGEFDKRTSDVT